MKKSLLLSIVVALSIATLASGCETNNQSGISGTQQESISGTEETLTLSKKQLEISIGDKITLICSDESGDVEWKSSDISVATVDTKGEVTAVGTGTCVITASIGERTAETNVTVEKKKPNLRAIYEKYGSTASYVKIASDDSYIIVDTNPYDSVQERLTYTDNTPKYAVNAMRKINADLGLPSSLLEEMGNTTALDGKQSETFENAGVKVTWRYSKKTGLEVMYSLL